MTTVSVTASPAPRVSIAPPGDAAPDLSFVLVTYGTGDLVVEAVASIAATTAGRRVEVIVVDNPHPRAADRALTEVVLWTRGVRVARPDSNLGFGGGCNLGAALAGSEVLVLLNPDAALTDGWMRPLLDALAEPDVMIAAPVLLDDSGDVQECGQVLFEDATTFPIRRRPNGSELLDVDYASAACWAMRRADFVGLGGFDEAFHPAYFEDVDFVLRVRRSGGRCVVHPRAEVVHRHGHGTPDAPEPAFAQRELLLSKWRDVLTAYPRPTAG